MPAGQQNFGVLRMMSKYLAYGVAGGAGVCSPIASAAWPAANRALYFPFEVERPMVVTQFQWFNGATVSGNVDVGVYSESGTLLVSTGSTAQSGTSAKQEVNVADYLLDRGVYYLGLALSSGTATLNRAATGSANDYLLSGMLQQDSAFPLPSTATFVSTTAQYVPMVVVAARTPI